MKRRAALEPLDDALVIVPGKRQSFIPATKAPSRHNGDLETGDDIEGEALPNARELERKKENVTVTCYMAMSLYMHPKYVLATALYWVSQYVNYSKRSELAWFTDHIERLLREPATLAVTSSSSLANHHSNHLKHTVLLRFAGSEMHAVTNEYYLALENQLLTESLLHLCQPEHEAFMVYRLHGLKAELELDCFRYDRVLNYFYEPGFFVLSSYYWYVRYLFHQSGGRDMSDFAPVLTRIAAPLRHLPSDPTCLCASNSNYAQKKAALVRDMAALYEILERGESPEEIEEQVDQLWCEKAAYCDAVQGERFMYIHNQLYQTNG